MRQPVNGISRALTDSKSGMAVADAERAEPLQEFLAGVLAGQATLALEQQPPHRLVFIGIEVDVLRDRPVRRHAGVVAAQVLERGFVHALNMETRGLGNPGEVGLSIGLFW